MPSPSSSLATLRPDLGGSLEEFNLAMDRKGFIGHRVFPVIEVMMQAGVYGKIPLEQLLQKRTTNRAPGGGYGRGNWKFTSDSYATEEHGWEEPVDDREAAMYRDYFDAELIAAQRALDAVLRNAEIRANDLLFNASVYTGSDLATQVSNEWDDYANATPIDDVEGAVQKVWDNSGIWPDSLVINRKVFRNLRLCEQIISKLKYQGGFGEINPNKINEQMLAQVFDLRQVIVGNSAKNTADEGLDASLSPIWSGEYASICKVAETNDIREPCVGRTLHWGGDGSSVDCAVETYRDETVRSNIVRRRHDVQEKRSYVEAAHMLYNITT